jgi:hypothetical protein
MRVRGWKIRRGGRGFRVWAATDRLATEFATNLRVKYIRNAQTIVLPYGDYAPAMKYRFCTMSRDDEAMKEGLTCPTLDAP